MDQLVDPRQGLATADNNRFLRQWFEVKHQNIKFNAKDIPDSVASGLKWFPYNKGGSYRKWYGNNDYVVNWENDGFEIRNFKDAKGKLRSRPQNTNFYFREVITWSLISSGGVSVRYKAISSIPDISAPFIYTNNQSNLLNVLALMNSKIGNYIFTILNPTINLSNGIVANLPIIAEFSDNLEQIRDNISITKTDWDSFETSWDFTTHPFMQHIDEHNRNLCLNFGQIDVIVPILSQNLVMEVQNG